MKKSRFSALFFVVALLLALCSSAVSALENFEDNEDYCLYVKSGEEIVIDNRDDSDLKTNSGHGIAIQKGGILRFKGKLTNTVFTELRMESGSKLIVEQGSYISFTAGDFIIAGSVIVEGKGSDTNLVFTLGELTIEDTGSFEIHGCAEFRNNTAENHGTITVDANGMMDVEGMPKTFLNYGKIDIKDNAELLNYDGCVVDGSFFGSVFADGAAGGYVLTGVGAFVLGAALMLIITRCTRKKTGSEPVLRGEPEAASKEAPPSEK